MNPALVFSLGVTRSAAFLMSEKFIFFAINTRICEFRLDHNYPSVDCRFPCLLEERNYSATKAQRPKEKMDIN
ncbi:MAG: hypothetical protein AUK24_01105 [Syntrophaceae bacterium CG2_30_49_12]|nr:MAG: hypothetical protein AUK24_01105 [Syntrophaceae bacterium CG2_30_49_12]